MRIEKIIENKQKEIKDLNRFRGYVQVLKENVGLSDETIKELYIKINCRVTQCEIIIRNYQKEIQ